MKSYAILLTLLALLMVAGTALAQAKADEFTISRGRVDNGVGAWKDSGGEFELRGTIGQPEGGAVASDEYNDYRLVGGYWKGEISAALRYLFLPLILN
jgi:hypothetical protein